MHIKKYEAPTIQEALDTIKRELGPDAVILQTKKYKKGFGLMSKPSVEVTVAVSESALHKKQSFERSLTQESREAVQRLPADRQRQYFETHAERRRSVTRATPQEQAPQTRPSRSSGAETAAFVRSAAGSRPSSREPGPLSDSSSRASSMRYADIQDDVQISAPRRGGDSAPVSVASGVINKLFGRYTGKSESSSTSSSMSDATMERARSVMAAANAAEARSAGSTDVHFGAPTGSPAGAGGLEASGGYLNFEAPAARIPVPADMRDEEPPSAPAPNDPELKAEIDRLKKMIIDMQNERESASGSASSAPLDSSLSTPALHDAFELLVMNGMERRYAMTVMKQAAFGIQAEGGDPASADDVLDRVATEVMENTEVVSMLDGIRSRRGSEGDTERSEPVKIALIGPTGVGKTTTVAKIASQAVKGSQLRVGLVSFVPGGDSGAEAVKNDTLALFAKILNVPFRRVTDAEALQIAMGEFGHLDLVLVDAGGTSHRDSSAVRAMHEALSSVQNLRSHLVLSATTRDVELYDAARRFSAIGPDGLVFTRLDEAMIYGSIYNVSQKFKLPLVCFTTGQGVPDDIEPATQERLAALVMDL